MLLQRLSRKLARKAASYAPVAATCVDYARYRLAHLSRRPRVQADAALVREVLSKGYAIVHGYLSAEECEVSIRDIEWMFANKQEHVQRTSDVRVFGAELFSASIARVASDPFLDDISEAVLGAEAVNAFTLANRVDAFSGSRGSGEGWHRDSAFRQFKSFVYLNDVTEDNGPLQIIEGSDVIADQLRSIHRFGLEYRKLTVPHAKISAILAESPGRSRKLTGPAGTLLLVNTGVLHRGCPPVKGTRYALTNYYVEEGQLSEAFIARFAPVSPEKLRRLKASWSERRILAKEFTQ